MQATVLFQIWRLAVVWYMRPVKAAIRPKINTISDIEPPEDSIYRMK